MNHILITGGAGYIGSHAVLAAIAAGLKPVVIDSLHSGFRAAVPTDVPFFQGSILDQAFLESVLSKYDFNAIMHFAGLLEVEESTRLPLKYYETNVQGTLSLLKVAAEYPNIKSFVFSSTCATYGTPQSLPVNELCQQLPLSPYGTSKLFAEKVIQDFCELNNNHMKYAFLRYFNVAGADPQLRAGQSTPRATQLIKICAEVALGKRPKLTIFGADYDTPDGTCIRDYIHVSDLSDAHVLALQYLNTDSPSTAFNLGYGKGYSVKEVINAMKKVSGCDFDTELQPRRAGDSSAIYSDTSKSTELLGFVPKYADLEFICKTALDWEKTRHY